MDLLSRLFGSGRLTPSGDGSEEPLSQTHSTEPAEHDGSQDEIRLGIDFGTSTTLVAVRIGGREPRVLRLEDSGDAMPSYLALNDGELLVGQAAVNAGVSAHSVKLALREDEPIPSLGDMRPTEAAYALIEAAVRRSLEQLKREGRLPSGADRLTVVSNVGCTPAFTLEQRVRLRDVCAAVGLEVRMTNLIEEPVAAAFEVSRSGAVMDGRTMVVDIGGGTVDISVLEVLDHGSRFILHATGGYELGGDRFTDLVAARLRNELAAIRGVSVDDLHLGRQDETAIWNRAETAKIALSTQAVVHAVLPGTDATEVELTRTWFESESHRLVENVIVAITTVYQRARLTLDREMSDHDRRPGTDAIIGPGGIIKRFVRQMRLADDGAEHLDIVYLVGGASQMPALQRRLAQEFGDRLFDVRTVGMDHVSPIVMGLARHELVDRVELRNPNWAVIAEFRDHGSTRARVEVYEPYAPLMELRPRRQTSLYRVRIRVPADCSGGTVAIVFQPVLRESGDRWGPVQLPNGAEELEVVISLFGDVGVYAGNTRLFPDRRSPFAQSNGEGDWLPRTWSESWREIVPSYDWRYDSA